MERGRRRMMIGPSASGAGVSALGRKRMQIGPAIAFGALARATRCLREGLSGGVPDGRIPSYNATVLEGRMKSLTSVVVLIGLTAAGSVGLRANGTPTRLLRTPSIS